MIRMGVLLLIGLMAGFFILVSNIYFKAAYVRVLDEKKAKLDAQTGALEQDFMKISLMREYFSQQGYALDVMAELIDLVNDAMELNEIRYDGKGILSVKGVSDSNSAVYSFVDSLSKSKYFKEVKTKYTTKRKEAGRDVVDFEVTSVLQKAKRGQ